MVVPAGVAVRKTGTTTDCVLDLGPEGGDKGGAIVARDTAEQRAQEPRSYTGASVTELLAKSERSALTPPRPKKKHGSALLRKGAGG